MCFLIVFKLEIINQDYKIIYRAYSFQSIQKIIIHLCLTLSTEIIHISFHKFMVLCKKFKSANITHTSLDFLSTEEAHVKLMRKIVSMGKKDTDGMIYNYGNPAPGSRMITCKIPPINHRSIPLYECKCAYCIIMMGQATSTPHTLHNFHTFSLFWSHQSIKPTKWHPAENLCTV